jgi:membrane protease YdiL (CAAX protease family)
MRREQLLWLAVAFEGGLFLLAAFLAWLLDLPLRDRSAWDWLHVVWAIAATLPPLVALWWMQHSTWGPLRRFRETIDRLVTPLFAECSWLDFAVISLVAGVGEESLFRGILQDGLAPWVGTAAAIIIAGIVFGLVHWVTPMYAFYATLMGIYLGCLLVWFDNLLVPMIVHGLYDFVALIYVTEDNVDSTVETPPPDR